MKKMTKTGRVLATGAVAALSAGALSVIGATSATAAPKTLEGNFAYKCGVIAGGLDLGVQDINVKASTVVPDAVSPGEVIPSTAVNITLTMPELLRQSTALLLGGREASGASTDSAVTLTTGGQTTSVAIPSLGAPRTPIPQTANEPWLIPATGTVPPITTPAYATGTVAIGLPAVFNITATIYKADNSTIPSSLSCTGPASLTLGTIAVKVPTTTTPPPTTTTPPADTIVPVNFKLKGSTTIKAGNGTAPLNGKIAAKFNLNKGTFDADLTLDNTTAKLKALGFLPVDAQLSFKPVGKTTGSLTAGKLSATSKTDIFIPSVKSFGLKIGGGATCKTSSPSTIPLTSTGTAFDPLKGGAVEGTYSVAKLQGCGVLNDVLSLFASGSGNKITATLAP